MRKQFVKSAARQMVMARSGSGVIHVGGGITTRVPGSVASLQRKHNFYVRIVHVDAPSVSQAFKKKRFCVLMMIRVCSVCLLGRLLRVRERRPEFPPPTVLGRALIERQQL